MAELRSFGLDFSTQICGFNRFWRSRGFGHETKVVVMNQLVQVSHSVMWTTLTNMVETNGTV